MSRPADPKHFSLSIESAIIWLGRIFLLALLVATPWMNGSILWEWQAWLIYSVPVALGFIGLLALVKRSAPVPSATWLLLFFAGFGYLQSLPLFNAEPNAWQPASVRIQQWFHGEPVSIQSRLLSPELQQSAKQFAGSTEASDVTTDKLALPSKLAISADPLHTRTAVGSLCLAAVVAWLSSLVWSQRARDQVLLSVICGLGCIMSCIFFFEATAITVPDWLMHDGHIMTGTFHSKNVAAAYLLAGLSAGIGLLVSRSQGTRNHRKKRDIASGYQISTLIREIQRIGERLRTTDVVLVCATILICVAVVGSQSRGSTLGTLVALACFWVVRGRGKVKGLYLFFGGAFTFVMIGMLAYLDLDSQTSERFEALLQVQNNQSGRLFVWWGAVRAGLYYLLTGCGLGNYGYGLLPFYESRADLWYFYAESFWGHVIAEFGIWGLLGLAWFIWSVSLQLRRALPSSRAVSIAFFILAVASIVHGLVDFCMIVPAVFLPFVMLWGAADGRTTNADQSLLLGSAPTSRHLPRWMPLFPFLFLAFLVWDASVAVQDSREIERLNRVVEGLLDREREVNESARDRYGDFSKKNISNAQYDRILGLLSSVAWRREYIAWQKQQAIQEVRWEQTAPILIRLSIMRIQKSDPEKVQELVGGRIALENLRQIQEHYARAAMKNPMDWRSDLGAILFDLQSEPDHQIRRLRRWIPLANNAPTSLMEAGLLLVELGDVSTGLSLCNRSMLLNPALSTQIAPIIATQLNDEQLETLRFPDERRILMQATALFTEAKFPKSNERLWSQLERSLISNPERSLEYWTCFAQSARRKQDSIKESEYLDRALQVKSDHIPSRIRWSQLLLERGELEEAKRVLKQGLTITPKNPILEKQLKAIQAE